jgi:hypothetical protein
VAASVTPKAGAGGAREAADAAELITAARTTTNDATTSTNATTTEAASSHASLPTTTEHCTGGSFTCFTCFIFCINFTCCTHSTCWTNGIYRHAHPQGDPARIKGVPDLL